MGNENSRENIKGFSDQRILAIKPEEVDKMEPEAKKLYDERKTAIQSAAAEEAKVQAVAANGAQSNDAALSDGALAEESKKR